MPWYDSLSPEQVAQAKLEEAEQKEWEYSLRLNGVIDSLKTNIPIIRDLKTSRENSLAVTKIEEAIMWLEKGVDKS